MNKIKFLLALLVSVFCLFTISNNVDAASMSIFPSADDTATSDQIFKGYPGDNTGFLEVSRSGGGNTLQATITRVEVYYTTTGTKTITLINAKQCGSPPDFQSIGGTDGDASTQFIFTLNSSVIYSGNNAGSCTSPNPHIVRSVTIPTNATKDPSTGMYRIVITATIEPGTLVKYPLVNAFKVRSDSPDGTTYVSLPDTAGGSGVNEYFAVQRRPGNDPSDPTGHRNFQIMFAQPCNINSINEKIFVWYDDDNAGIEASNSQFGFHLSHSPRNSISWSSSPSDIIDNGSGVNTPTINWGVPSLGSPTGYSGTGLSSLNNWRRIITKDNGSGDYGAIKFNMDPDLKYRAIFTNVSNTNGIRFKLPYSSIYATRDCPVPVTNPTGDISAGYNCTVPPTIGYKLSSPLNKGYITATPSSGYPTLQKNITNTSAGTLKLTDWSPALSPSVTYVYRLYGYASDNTVKNSSGVANSPISTLTASQDISCPPPDSLNTYPVTPYYPSFQTLNADTVVGGGFGSSCAPKDSGIFAYMKSSSTIDGSGSQLGSFASGDIKGFRSAISNSAYKTLGRGLTFGGSSSGLSGLSPSIGGNYASVSCMKDYFTDTQYSDSTKLVSPATNFGDSTHNNKQVTYTGDKTISGLANYGNKTTYYVDGNVYIAGNITYANPAGWANASAIPNFTLVVKGNIYIDNSVTQLDGVYIAQPDGNSGGTIYTCAGGSGVTYDESGIKDNCVGTNYGQTTTSTSTLTFNGVVIANKLVLARVLGDVLSTSPATNTPAEIFNYSPEVILSPPLFRTANGADAGNDDIGILPPIL